MIRTLISSSWQRSRFSSVSLLVIGMVILLVGVLGSRLSGVSAAVATNCATQTDVPKVECEALLDLYRYTNGQIWYTSTGWAENNSICSWYGVTCEEGSVVSINLFYNRLIGSIPPSLGNLINLRNLDLSWNQLSGSIPASLGNLTKLQNLRLRLNRLSGSIPTPLGNLAHLQVLDLSHNQLEGNIPDSLGSLTMLQTLSLSSNELSGSIPESLGRLSNLQTLALSHNRLSGKIPISLADLTNVREGQASIHSNRLDTNVDNENLLNWLNEKAPGWQNQWITDCAAQTDVPREECEALRNLYQSTNGLRWSINTGWGVSDGVCSWHGVTCESGSVISLALSGNRLVGNIPGSLGDLTKLQILDLSNNELRGGIPAELGELTELQILDLSDNQLSGGIPTSLGGLANLRTLDLSGNPLGRQIPETLGNLTNLQTLDLSDSGLEGSIPESLGRLDKLQLLDLSDNELSGNIPALLGNLTHVQYLSLSGNELRGGIPLPLANLTNLRILDLSYNELDGNIPTSLSNLTNIWDGWAKIGSNQLDTRVPDQALLDWLNKKASGWQEQWATDCAAQKYVSQAECEALHDLYRNTDGRRWSTNTGWGEHNRICQWHGITCENGAVKTLDLSGNRLSKSIPETLGNLTKLQILDLSENELWGNIPESLGNLTNLQILNLSSNRLSGDIPASLISLTSARAIIIDGNRLNTDTDHRFLSEWLESKAPGWRNQNRKVTNCASQTGVPQTECEALMDLYRSTDGPRWFAHTGWGEDDNVCGWYGVTCENGSVKQLILARNRLSGTIPASLSKLTNLQKLDLSRNQLRGTIPASLGNLTKLQLISLSENQLRGSIPESLANLTNVEQASFHNNHLNVEGVPSALSGWLSSKAPEWRRQGMPPYTPAITSLGLVNDRTPTIAGTAKAGSTVRVMVKLSSEGAVTYATTLTNTSCLWSIDTGTATPIAGVFPRDGLTDGTYEITVRTTDATGGASNLATQQLTIDTVAPEFPRMTSPNVTQDTTPTIAGTAEARATVRFAIVLEGVQIAMFTTVAGEDGTWSVDTGTTTPTSGVLPRRGLQDGMYIIVATAEDMAGNISSPTGYQLAVDTTPPAAPTITSLDVTNDRTPTITGTAEAESTIRVVIDLGGGTTSTFATVTGLNGYWSVDTNTATPTGEFPKDGLAEGTYIITATATDAAGNISRPTIQQLTVDTTPPAAPTITSPSLASGRAPTILGMAEAESTVRVTIDLGNGKAVTFAVRADSDGSWGVDTGTMIPTVGVFPSRGLADGTYVVTVLAIDAAGNVSGPTIQQLKVSRTAPDITPPSAPTITSPSLTNGSTPTIVGVAEAGSTVRVAIEVSGGITVTFTTVADERGNWSVDTGTAAPTTGAFPDDGLADGTYTITVTATDAVGNTSRVRIWKLTVSTRTDHTTNCATQTDVSQVECEALLDLYRSTNGPNWLTKTGWGENDSICSWHGVTCRGGAVISLSLPSNRLSGIIPTTLGNLTNLQKLDLFLNQLIGGIPDTLGNLTNLQELDLSMNQLIGSIPDTLGNLTNLQRLCLESNQLIGGIPDTLGNLTKLEELYLSDNQLSGSIPTSLAKLTGGERKVSIRHNYLDTNVTDQALLVWLDTYVHDWQKQRSKSYLYLPIINKQQ